MTKTDLIINKDTESGVFFLNSNQRVIIAKDVTFSGTTDDTKYYADDSIMFKDNCGNELGRALIIAHGVENVELCGQENAVIDGRGYSWKKGESSARPSLVRFVDCKNVIIRDLKLTNSACWCLHLQNCHNVIIKNVQIISDCNSNNDGIDVDCCTDVTIDGCYIENGDDAIVLKSTKNLPCQNISVQNCTVKTKGAGFKVGTESVGDFKNVTYKNNKIIFANGCAVKIVPVDGAKVQGVLVENVVAEQTTGPIFIANGTRQRVYFSGQEKSDLSQIKDVVIKNVKANVFVRNDGYAGDGRGVVFMTGTKENKIDNVIVKDCVFSMPGGENDDGKQYFVKELSKEYPEYYLLGDAPAYGSFIRHAKNVKFENVKFNLQKPDVRKEIYLTDVENFEKL